MLLVCLLVRWCKLWCVVHVGLFVCWCVGVLELWCVGGLLVCWWCVIGCKGGSFHKPYHVTQQRAGQARISAVDKLFRPTFENTKHQRINTINTLHQLIHHQHTKTVTTTHQSSHQHRHTTQQHNVIKTVTQQHTNTVIKPVTNIDTSAQQRCHRQEEKVQHIKTPQPRSPLPRELISWRELRKEFKNLHRRISTRESSKE